MEKKLGHWRDLEARSPTRLHSTLATCPLAAAYILVSDIAVSSDYNLPLVPSFLAFRLQLFRSVRVRGRLHRSVPPGVRIPPFVQPSDCVHPFLT